MRRLLVALALVAGLSQASAHAEERRLGGVLVVTDAAHGYDESVSRLLNLLDGMGLDYATATPAEAADARLRDYELVIAAASTGGPFDVDERTERALARAREDGVNLLWVGRGVWGSFRTTLLPDTFGIRYVGQGWNTDAGVAAAGFADLDGRPDRLLLPKQNLLRVEAKDARVLGWNLDAEGRPTPFPFITERAPGEDGTPGRAIHVSLPILDFWKSGEAADTFAQAEILQGLILRSLGRGAVAKHPVRDARAGVMTLRLEDYTPGGAAMQRATRPWLLRMEWLLKIAHDHGLPLNIALVPRFAHPFTGETHGWGAAESDHPDAGIATLRDLARRALAAGGALVVHGYKHQNGAGPDDFSGDDFEMWDEDLGRFLSPDEQRRVTDAAMAEVRSVWGVTPRIWETPHYASDAATYAAAAASGFAFANESDTKLFPNRDGYLDKIAGHLLNLPETGFNYPLGLDAIRTSALVKQEALLPRLVRLRGYLNLFYHNMNSDHERALRNLLAVSDGYDLWKPNLEELGDFWEARARAGVAATVDPAARRLVAEVRDAVPGLALTVRLPDGTRPVAVTVDGGPVAARTREVAGGVRLVEPVLRAAGAHRVAVEYAPDGRGP